MPPMSAPAKKSMDTPETAQMTLDDDIGFLALVDRMQENHALKVVNSARISYSNQKTLWS